MAGIDYRQLQAPEQVNTDLPNSGAATRAEALSGVFKDFEGITSDVYAKAQTQAGALAGAAAGATGHPQYREGLERFTAYSKAFNNAATGAYAVEAEAQADDAAARLRVQANNNPDTFRTTFSAVRDAVLKNAPAESVPMLTELYNKHLAAGLGAISGDQAAELKLTQRQAYDAGVERDISVVAKLTGSANQQDQLAGEDQLVKLTAKINGGVNTGLYSVAEGQAKLINAHREITSQVFEIQLDHEIGLMSQSGDAGDVVKLLDNFRAAHEKNLSTPGEPPILSEPEFNTLMTNAKSKLMQERTELFYAKYGQKTAEQAKLDAGDRKITVMLASNVSPAVIMRNVASMIATEDLKPEVGRAVLSSLQRGQDAPADPRALFFAENNPSRFDWTPDQIIAQAGGNAKGAITLATKIETERNSWESRPAIKDARAFISSALKLPTGVALETASDEQKLASVHAQVEFTAQMNKIDVAKREQEAPRVARNVALEMQARDSEAAAAAWQKGKNYVEYTFGPKGTSPNPTKYNQGIAAADAKAKAAQDQAAQFRQGIKQ